MLNSLANHGFLHCNSRDISVEDLVDAFENAPSLSPYSTLPVAQLCVTTSTTGNQNTLNLKVSVPMEVHNYSWFLQFQPRGPRHKCAAPAKAGQ